MKLEWMPPLPLKQVVYTQMPDDYRYGNKYAYTEQQMRDYARAAIARFIARQKPVAWRYVRSDGGRSLSLFPPNEVSEAAGLIGQPLYRLDGGDDE